MIAGDCRCEVWRLEWRETGDDGSWMTKVGR
jgi:hypothetical protein